MQSLRVSIVEDLTRRNVRERHVGDVVREVLRLREELKVLPAAQLARNPQDYRPRRGNGRWRLRSQIIHLSGPPPPVRVVLVGTRAFQGSNSVLHGQKVEACTRPQHALTPASHVAGRLPTRRSLPSSAR